MKPSPAWPLFDVETEIARCRQPATPRATASALLALGERAIEAWVEARGEIPTMEAREGFRLLGLHRQGSRGEPSFNACRETARELVYYYNLVSSEPHAAAVSHRLDMMAMLARHLCLFIAAKLETAGIGEFCCSSKPLRQERA